MISFFIARRYLFSRKTRNAVNLITLIAVIGFAAGTMALVVVLSVFNGFDQVVNSLYNTYDPPLKITPLHGKYIEMDSGKIAAIRNISEVESAAEVLEENALVRYADRQTICMVRGVDKDFFYSSAIVSAITSGDSTPWKWPHFAVVGRGLGNRLGVDFSGQENMHIYMPDKETGNILADGGGFRHQEIYPSHEFSIQQEIDSRTMLIPLKVMQELLDKEREISSLEISLKKDGGVDVEDIREKLYHILGKEVVIKDRLEQHELLNRVMKSEKRATYIILSFILLIFTFNMVAGLFMLVLEKKSNIQTLVALGANKNMIRNIFLQEGILITIIGTMLGLVLGFAICWLQIEYGFVSISQSDTLVISSYPVQMRAMDFVYIFITALLLGIFASWYPAAKAAGFEKR